MEGRTRNGTVRLLARTLTRIRRRQSAGFRLVVDQSTFLSPLLGGEKATLMPEGAAMLCADNGQRMIRAASRPAALEPRPPAPPRHLIALSFSLRLAATPAGREACARPCTAGAAEPGPLRGLGRPNKRMVARARPTSLTRAISAATATAISFWSVISLS